MKAPAKLGTVWAAKAKIQRIRDGKWETLVECMDTPNAIEQAVQELLRDGYKLKFLWVVGDVTERKMVDEL